MYLCIICICIYLCMYILYLYQWDTLGYLSPSRTILLASCPARRFHMVAACCSAPWIHWDACSYDISRADGIDFISVDTTGYLYATAAWLPRWEVATLFSLCHLSWIPLGGPQLPRGLRMPDHSWLAIAAAAHPVALCRACGLAGALGQTWAARMEDMYQNTESLMLSSTTAHGVSDGPMSEESFKVFLHGDVSK